jgi:hypothetical protein
MHWTNESLYMNNDSAPLIHTSVIIVLIVCIPETREPISHPLNLGSDTCVRWQLLPCIHDAGILSILSRDLLCVSSTDLAFVYPTANGVWLNCILASVAGLYVGSDVAITYTDCIGWGCFVPNLPTMSIEIYIVWNIDTLPKWQICVMNCKERLFPDACSSMVLCILTSFNGHVNKSKWGESDWAQSQ